MRRHQRRHTLSAMEIAATVDALERLHHHLMIDLTNLTPAEAHYRTLEKISFGLVNAIRELTGEDPHWIQPSLGLSCQPNMTR